MCNEVFWAPLVQALPPAFDVRVADYGDASSITAMAQAALDCAAPRFSLAGHSMGGRVALEVVRLAPDRVNQLILMDTGYLPLAAGDAGALERAGRVALLDTARRDGVRAMCTDWVKGMVHPARLSDATLINAILDMFATKDAARFACQIDALLSRPDAIPVLANLTIPTMLLCGRQDSWAGVAQHEAMQELATRARLSVVEEAGHMVLMEQPETTARAILDFLG